MLRYAILLVLGVTSASYVAAQSLYMPRDITKAFKNNTRSMDGRPGKNYWQNHGRYDITVTAQPPDRTIRGKEDITYINNSPDTLENLVIKLFLNIHKPGAARLTSVSQDYLTDGMHIDGFSVNGQQQRWRNSSRYMTWQPVNLAVPLMPHDSIKLSFIWHYEISLQSNREGMIDSTTYYLAYFYPRVAVYDDYNGWDRMDFNDALEFYSDFNDYNVTVNVPKNYIVAGTGTLQQPEKLLQPAIAQRLQASQTSDEVHHIASFEEMKAQKVTTQNELNSWQFKATNIPDMAFGLSDHYVWDASSVIVDDATKRRASVQAMYNDTAQDFHHMIGFARHSLDWLSHKWPGIPYPYEKMTVFQGYADMEYPMMANDGSTPDTNFTRFVAEHEIAHTYMPFYMGINETRYGFMDEGWATTFELLIGREDQGVEKAEDLYKEFRIDYWIHDATQAEDIPIITPGDAMNGIGLGNNEYGKASIGYLAMKDLLGDELFKKCLHAYMDRWHGKHPLPWDFFHTFNNVSGKDLNWFWTNWFFTNNYIDLAVKRMATTAQGYTLTVDNNGGMAAPFDVKITYTDGSSDNLHQTPLIWQANQKQAQVHIATKKKIQSLVLDGGIFMDATTDDNKWTAGS